MDSKDRVGSDCARGVLHAVAGGDSFTGMGDFLPGPAETFAEFFRRFVKPYGKAVLPMHMWSSLRRILIGYTVASASGDRTWDRNGNLPDRGCDCNAAF